MPISLQELAVKNFDNETIIDGNTFENLLQKDGKFTLDDDGKLAVITPKRRDNWFVRFFKGLFSSAYRKEQRLLDRMEILSQNVSFCAKLRLEIVNRYAPNTTNLPNNEKFVWIQSFQCLLNNLQHIVNPGVSANQLNAGEPAPVNLLSTREIIAAERNANNSLEFFRANNEDVLMLKDGSVRTVLVSHESQSFKEFLLENLTDTSGLPSFNEMLAPVCNKLIKSSADDAKIGGILTGEDLRRFCELAAKTNLSDGEKSEFNSLREKAGMNIVNHMTNFINNALAAGADAHAVADNLKLFMINIGRGNTDIAGCELSFMLNKPQQFADAYPAAAQQERELPDTVYTNKAFTAAHNDKAYALQIINFCNSIGLNSAYFDLAVNVKDDVAFILNDLNKDLESYSDIVAALNNIKNRLNELRNTGMDELMPIFALAGFLAVNEGYAIRVSQQNLYAVITAFSELSGEINGVDAGSVSHINTICLAALSSLPLTQKCDFVSERDTGRDKIDLFKSHLKDIYNLTQEPA